MKNIKNILLLPCALFLFADYSPAQSANRSPARSDPSAQNGTARYAEQRINGQRTRRESPGFL